MSNRFDKRGRKSPRELKLAINASLRFLGIPVRTEVKPLRERTTPGADGRPLERNVLKAVIKALRSDPRVASVERNQSGVFQAGNRTISVGSRGKLDLTVYLKSGAYMEIEVKRDVRTQPSEAQGARILKINRSGGRAGWCWSVETALALLP